MRRRDFARSIFAGSVAAALPTLLQRTVAGAVTTQARVNGARLNGTLAQLSRFGRNDKGGITRVAYSEADREARAFVMDLMRGAGMNVRVDAAGNIIGRLDGTANNLPPLMTGSHIDSVPEGGNYDGQVGSMAAIEVAHTLRNSSGLRHPLEVVIFQNEENGKVGSKAIRGQDPATYLDLTTHSGKTVREGIRFIGGDPDRVLEARRERGSIAACVELHIEQGAVLQAAGIPIGVVQGIVGIKRWNVTVTGFANHAGTTPMDRRQDALLGAARFIDMVHRVSRAVPGPHVATVGTIAAVPGAPNVIPGEARLSLEIRDLQMPTIDRLFENMRIESDRIASSTGTRFAFAQNYRTEPAACDARIQDVIEEAARSVGLSARRLPSGAGHDAQEIAQLAPTGMIFIPSRGGISHSAEEYSAPEQITAGADVLLRTLISLDASAGWSASVHS
jgi:N-carbamoyl-L-amino-acid hydrolase